jgi:hypothetical protein
MIPDELHFKKARKARRCCYSQQPFYASSYVFGIFQPVICNNSVTEPVCGKYILYVPSYFILSTLSTNSLLSRSLWLVRVANPHYFKTDTDLDPSFHLMRIRIRISLFILSRIRIRTGFSLFILTRIRIRLFTLMGIWIWILLLNKVMRISDHWSKDPPWLDFEHYASVVSVHGPPWLYLSL